MSIWETAMGILSDLFGAGRQRDATQDQQLSDLAARVAALERAPSADNGAAIETLTAHVNTLQVALAELASRVTAIAERQVIDSTARAAVQSVSDRVTAIEREIEDVRALDAS